MNDQEKSKQRDAILEKIVVNVMTDSPCTEKYVDEFVNMISIEIGEAISPISGRRGGGKIQNQRHPSNRLFLQP